jgi:hypothetical protein
MIYRQNILDRIQSVLAEVGITQSVEQLPYGQMVATQFTVLAMAFRQWDHWIQVGWFDAGTPFHLEYHLKDGYGSVTTKPFVVHFTVFPMIETDALVCGKARVYTFGEECHEKALNKPSGKPIVSALKSMLRMN